MKYIISTIIATTMFFFSSYCQQVVPREIPEDRFDHYAQRYFIEGKDSFLVKYNYSTWFYTQPSVLYKVYDSATGKWREFTEEEYARTNHYDAKIKVFRVKNGKQKQIGEEMSGTYVPAGCFEDAPGNYVTQAKKSVLTNKN